MSFLYPHVLWALLLPFMIAAAAVLRHRRAGTAWRKLVSPAHEGELVRRRAPWKRLLGGIFGILALTLVLVAAARPINGYREAGITAGSRNLLLALDISRSMETQDVSPSRLEEARAAAYELIDALPEDKIGLIVFSGEADLVVPLTYDHTALRDALEQVDRSWAGMGGTDFNKVLRKAMQDFSRSAPDGTNALVLLSDGEDTTEGGTDITAEAKEKQLLVIAVGIGTEAGGPIPDPEGDNGLWQDADGKHVISKLNTESLRRFAKETNGDYVAMNSQTDLAAFARRAVRHINRHEEEVSLNKVPNDCFALFAGSALLFLLLSVLCSTDWRLPQLSLLLVALVSTLAPANAAPSEKALDAYRLGLQHMGSNREEAKGFFSEALLDDDKALQAAAFYEIGNTNTRATLEKLRSLLEPSETGDDDDPDTPVAAPRQNLSKKVLQEMIDSLREDLGSYESALQLDPHLRQAASNKRKVEELIRVLEEELKREDPPSDQQDQQQQDQNDQNDQQQDQQQQDQNDQNDQGQDQQQQDQNDQNDQGQDQQQQDQNDQNDQQQDQQQQDQNDQNDQQQDPGKQDPQQGDQDKQQDQPDQQQSQQQEEKTADQQQNEQQAQEAGNKEKAEQRAASILQMHLDEEHGSPIPHAELPVRPPKKDY